MPDLNLNHVPPPPSRVDFPIGVVGSGFIVRDVQLVAYARAGYRVAAIASNDPPQAAEVAAVRNIPRVYATVGELLSDPSIQIVDVAVPPHVQPAIVRAAVLQRDHIRGLLLQKPLATSYADAVEIARLCADAGMVASVNQNMRYDQSIRALKTLLDRGDLGEPVLATIEMRAVPHWQKWLEDYGRLTLLNMSIHHLDCFRYLFGTPESVYASVRTDPRTSFPHSDGICLYILEYENGMRASAWDDVWAGPEPACSWPDAYIKWRVEGTDGVAQGTVGWPAYPNACASTIEFSTKTQPGCWFRPRWKEVWFPDAFAGTMGELLEAVATGGQPPTSVADNLDTMALLEACYRSIQLHRPVAIAEVKGEIR